MKKFFILMLSTILWGENPVFAMDPPEGDEYNEAYHKLPRIQLQTIGHPLDVKNLLDLQKLLMRKGSRFQTQDGHVYEINQEEFPALCYLAGEYMPYSSGRADLRRINEMTFVAMEKKDTTISHTYESHRFGARTVTFKKVDLQHYVQVDWNKNQTPSEIALFKALHEQWHVPVTPTPGQDTSKQNIPEQDDLLGPWEDLASSSPSKELPPEDLLRPWIPLEEDLGSSSPLHGPTFENLLTSWIPLEEDPGSSLSQDPTPPEDLLRAQIYNSDPVPQPIGWREWAGSKLGLGS